jgi:hypothetical protein
LNIGEVGKALDLADVQVTQPIHWRFAQVERR